ASLMQGAAQAAPARAPEFTGIEKWLNSEPLTMESLRGKVVLVDFWTYTCINCIRTLPYVTSWHQKYKDQGLVVVGVHTPEFP
ncbi:redoxin domain-containing protein, partial [Paenibacillus polymyxa]|nr:redoxin domain-containing protein [Paenibacillus polymyxa]